jgi:hypothetical protein
LYPNPADNILNIKLDTKQNKGELRIISTTGNTINIESFEGEISLNVEKYSKGIYFIEIKTNEGIVRKMFVKE